MKYVCGICGKSHEVLDAYLECVSKCGETLKAKEKAEEEKKRLEKLNAELNKVKQAKAYYEEVAAKFEKEYPEEYKLNFGNCSHDTCKCSKSDAKTKAETIELSYEDDGKGKPKMSAKVNGKEVKGGILDEVVKELKADPEYQYLNKLLSML